VVLDVILECEKLEFRESFILCELDEINLILGDTFFEAHTVDVKQKLAPLVVCHDGEEVTLWLN
jgi:hypothetical protein